MFVTIVLIVWLASSLTKSYLLFMFLISFVATFFQENRKIEVGNLTNSELHLYSMRLLNFGSHGVTKC